MSVSFQLESDVAILTMRGKKNVSALTLAMANSLIDALLKASSHSSCRAVLLCAQGNFFCVGAALDGPEDTASSSALSVFNAAIRAIRQCPLPVVCCLAGPAAGGGVGLALACDLIVASSSAYLYPGAFLHIALMPDCGVSHFLLHSGLPYQRVFQLITSKERVRAEELFRLGIVQRVVSPETTRSAALQLAKQLCSLPHNALVLSKRALQNAQLSSLSGVQEQEERWQPTLVGQPDNVEGIQAFMKKRKPRFIASKL